MKYKMKNITGHILFLYGVLCLLFVSCDSPLDNPKTVETSFNSELCVVKTGQQGHLLNDDGVILNPVSTEILDGFTNDDRVLVTYNVVEKFQNSNSVKVYDIQRVPVLDVLGMNDLVVNINDPLWLRSSPWLGGGYINLEFSFGRSDLNIKHGIYMVQHETENYNGKTIINLQFGHNAKSDPAKKTSIAFTSVRLSSIKDIDKADKLVILVNEGTKKATYNINLTK
jgi:hypothetical protein